MKTIKIANFLIGPNQPLAFISGPCVIEDEDHALFAAEELKKLFMSFGFSYIFKASFDKANRSSIHSFRGPGLEEGLRILEKIKTKLDLPILTDIHLPEQVTAAAEVCDVIQIPAFLCRQTDLVVAAAKTKCPINVKKGQFMSPWDMKNVVDKIIQTENENILLTDRGTSFGYNNLVSDMRAIPVMQQLGFPVCFDASHSIQLPGGLGNASGGQREFIPILAKASVAAGCNALFIESHPNPEKAKSDAASVMGFKELALLLKDIDKIYTALQEK